MIDLGLISYYFYFLRKFRYKVSVVTLELTSSRISNEKKKPPHQKKRNLKICNMGERNTQFLNQMVADSGQKVNCWLDKTNLQYVFNFEAFFSHPER